MRALTVRLPWPWPIAKGFKPVENRNWRTKYRGPVAIHVAQRLDDHWVTATGFIADLTGLSRTDVERAALEVPTSAIVCVVDLVDVHGWDECVGDDGSLCSPWADDAVDAVHFALEHRLTFDEPIACKGALGLWTPPGDVLEQLERLGVAA